MVQVKIVILSENSVRRRGMIAEHGLAFFIKSSSGNLLFDTGQGLVLTNNAEVCGIDLETLDAVALSHGHYDHAGGLKDVLALKPDLPVYAHPDALSPKYSQAGDGKVRENGIDPDTREMIRTFIPVEAPTEPLPGIWMTGPVPRETSFEDTGGDFFADECCSTSDPIKDDQALFFETSKGLVVLTGCAHSGIVNILTFVRSLRPEIPFRAIIGGFHLEKASGDRTSETVRYLKETGVDELFPMHCVGRRAWSELRANLGGRCREARAGSTLEFQ